MKMFGKILGWIAKLILILMLVTLIIPIAYLAWRADQPMELPQFNGLTYHQYLNWRKTTLHQMAVEYQSAHPNAKMGGGLDMCYRLETSITLGLKLPLSGYYTLAGIFPYLEETVTQADRQYIPNGINPTTFLPNWWKIYEELLWSSANFAPNLPTPYCRLQPDIPSPTEYEAMISVSHP